MSFIRSLRLDGLLSFRPGSDPIALTPLNVIIGPNGSGKSNLIEAIELLHSTPTAFAAPIRDGGGAAEWLWQGEGRGAENAAMFEAIVQGATGKLPSRALRDLRDHLDFRAIGARTEVTGEAIDRTKPEAGQKDV